MPVLKSATAGWHVAPAPQSAAVLHSPHRPSVKSPCTSIAWQTPSHAATEALFGSQE